MDKYLPSDFRSLELHTLIAEKLKNDPALFKKPFENIARWKKQNSFPQPYLDDWLFHLNQGLDHVLNTLIRTDDEGQRLRSSSPFVGILSQEERHEIFKKYAGETFEDPGELKWLWRRLKEDNLSPSMDLKELLSIGAVHPAWIQQKIEADPEWAFVVTKYPEVLEWVQEALQATQARLDET